MIHDQTPLHAFALILVTVLGLSAGCKSLAPEATELSSQVLANCVGGNTSAIWAITNSEFRATTDEAALESQCRVIRERLGEFRQVDRVSSLDRQQRELTMSLETTFEVGEVQAELVWISSDGEWSLRLFHVAADAAPRLPEDLTTLLPMANEVRDRFLTAEFDAFHQAFAPELQSHSSVDQLRPALENLFEANGTPSASEPTVEPNEERQQIVYPLEYDGGSSHLLLEYEWRGAAWALIRFDVGVPGSSAGRAVPAERLVPGQKP